MASGYPANQSADYAPDIESAADRMVRDHPGVKRMKRAAMTHLAKGYKSGMHRVSKFKLRSAKVGRGWGLGKPGERKQGRKPRKETTLPQRLYYSHVRIGLVGSGDRRELASWPSCLRVSDAL